ncbi:hypothetical protein B0H10DRAFT_2030998 [Mycena sp. CBHHK59/15]|nr:hypothetical protein B0H10DRAFT_2030998 [Mycena sp. CBHHK59/15]
MSATHPAPVFPRTLPRDQPPPVYNTQVNGRSTPLYGLAWVCTHNKFHEIIGGEPLSIAGDQIRTRWNKHLFNYALQPETIFEEDGNYYLVAMRNKSNANHIVRAHDPNDELVDAARKAMCIDSEIEPTLQWYRFPLQWNLDEQRKKEEEALRRLYKSSDNKD